MAAVPLLSSQLTNPEDATRTIHQYESGEHEQPWGYSIHQLRDGSFELDVAGRGSGNWLPGLCNDLFRLEVRDGDRGPMQARLAEVLEPLVDCYWAS